MVLGSPNIAWFPALSVLQQQFYFTQVIHTIIVKILAAAQWVQDPLFTKFSQSLGRAA